MINLFEFTDFTEYLQRYYGERKKANARFSYQALARKAGIKNKGFIFNIINGTKKLTKSHCYQLSQALGHTIKEAEYFECIVGYAQAKNEEERVHFLKQALQIAGSVNPGTRLLGQDRFEYYSTWYHSTIRSLINMYQVNDNYEQLCRWLSPPISIGEVKKSIQLLSRLKLIVKGKDGFYHIADERIRTSNQISRTAKNQFHIQCAELAKRAILKDPPDTRHAVSITMGISRKAYDEIVSETKTFVNTLINRAKNDNSRPECVYQYELLLFPLSITKRQEQNP